MTGDSTIGQLRVQLHQEQVQLRQARQQSDPTDLSALVQARQTLRTDTVELNNLFGTHDDITSAQATRRAANDALRSDRNDFNSSLSDDQRTAENHLRDEQRALKGLTGQDRTDAEAQLRTDRAAFTGSLSDDQQSTLGEIHTDRHDLSTAAKTVKDTIAADRQDDSALDTALTTRDTANQTVHTDHDTLVAHDTDDEHTQVTTIQNTQHQITNQDTNSSVPT